MISQNNGRNNIDVKRVMTAPTKKKEMKNFLKSPNSLKILNTGYKTFHSEKDCVGNPILWMRQSKHQKKNSREYIELRKKYILLSEKEEKGKIERNDKSKFNKFNNVSIKENDISNNNINGNKTIEEILVNSSNEIIKNNNNTISEEKKESSDDKFIKSVSNKNDLDQYLHKTLISKNFNFIPGEKIHEGPQAIIYKCLNLKTGEIFASKYFINPLNSNQNKYEKEIQILKELSHPNIIKYLGNEIIDNTPFLFMEYASNGSLKNIIDNFGPFNENLIKIYLKQIIEGLKYLHNQGIIHRDIKCANLLMNNNKILIADFGTSKKNYNENKEDIFTQSLVGTFSWSAPEVITHRKYGIKADIWSLGCTIIEMTTGKIPWSEKKFDNLLQIMNVIGKGNEIPLIPNFLSKNLQDLIIMCLNRNDNERANCDLLLKHPFFNEE